MDFICLLLPETQNRFSAIAVCIRILWLYPFSHNFMANMPEKETNNYDIFVNLKTDKKVKDYDSTKLLFTIWNKLFAQQDYRLIPHY